MQDLFESDDTSILSIESEIAYWEGEIKVKRLNQFLHFIVFLIAIIIPILAIVLQWTIDIQAGIYVYGFDAAIVIYTLMQIYDYHTSISKLKSKIKGLSATEDKINKGNMEDKEKDYFNQLVLINANNLRENYKTVTNQNKTSFKLAVITSIIGFMLLIAGLSVGFLKLPQFNFSPFLSTGSGIIVEFIAGVFFLFHNRSVQQMKEYHLTSIKTQNTLFAFKLVEDAKDEDTKAKIIAMIAARLMEGNDNIVTPEK